MFVLRLLNIDATKLLEDHDNHGMSVSSMISQLKQKDDLIGMFGEDLNILHKDILNLLNRSREKSAGSDSQALMCQLFDRKDTFYIVQYHAFDPKDPKAPHFKYIEVKLPQDFLPLHKGQHAMPMLYYPTEAQLSTLGFNKLQWSMWGASVNLHSVQPPFPTKQHTVIPVGYDIEIGSLSWHTVDGMKAAARCLDLLCNDNTCKTNKQKYFFGLLLAANGNNNTSVVLNNMQQNQTDPSFHFLYSTAFILIYGAISSLVQTVTVDGDPQCIGQLNSAIHNNIFPNAKYGRDEWHACWLPLAKLESSCVKHPQANKCNVFELMHAWVHWTLHHTETQTDFDSTITAIKAWLESAYHSSTSPSPQPQSIALLLQGDLTRYVFDLICAWLDGIVKLKEQLALPWRMHNFSLKQSSTGRVVSLSRWRSSFATL